MRKSEIQSRSRFAFEGTQGPYRPPHHLRGPIPIGSELAIQKKARDSMATRRAHATTSTTTGTAAAAAVDLLENFKALPQEEQGRLSISELHALPTIGRLKRELGPRVSPDAMETLHHLRRRASKTVFNSWLERKAQEQEQHSDEETFQTRVQKKCLRSRRRASLVAYANWCADKDDERGEEALIHAEQERQERELQAARERERRQRDAEFVQEVSSSIQADMERDIRRYMHRSVSTPMLQSLSPQAQREIFVGLSELQAALDAVIRSEHTSERPPERL